ncbi:MAG: hypothetical protein RL028_888 [Actinomycetota bacterium]|jgi:hypothetical protein
MSKENSQPISEKEFYWLGVNDQIDFLESLKALLGKLGLSPGQVTQLKIDVLATLDDLQSLKRMVRDRMKPIKGTSVPNMYELRWDFAGLHGVRYGIRLYFVEETKWIIGLRWQVKPLTVPSEVSRALQNIEIKKAEEIYLKYRRKEIV